MINPNKSHTWFIYTAQCDGQLKVVQILDTDVDRILQLVSKQEKSSRICYKLPKEQRILVERTRNDGRYLRAGKELTKSLLSEQSKGVFQRSCSPTIEIKVVGKECDHFALFSMTVRCPPKTVKQLFLPQGNVKQSTRHRVLPIFAHVLVPSNNLHLFDL